MPSPDGGPGARLDRAGPCDADRRRRGCVCGSIGRCRAAWRTIRWQGRGELHKLCPEISPLRLDHDITARSRPATRRLIYANRSNHRRVGSACRRDGKANEQASARPPATIRTGPIGPSIERKSPRRQPAIGMMAPGVDVKCAGTTAVSVRGGSRPAVTRWLLARRIAPRDAACAERALAAGVVGLRWHQSVGHRPVRPQRGCRDTVGRDAV
jgi:hypothetical protein